MALVKMIGNLNKTITLVKEVIPLYRRISPLIKNSGDLLKKINNFNISNNVNDNVKKNNSNSVEIKDNTIYEDGPTFFL